MVLFQLFIPQLYSDAEREASKVRLEAPLLHSVCGSLYSFVPPESTGLLKYFFKKNTGGGRKIRSLRRGPFHGK